MNTRDTHQFPEQFGRYEVVRVIGRGAMGLVFEGFDPLINRKVAIKVIRIPPWMSREDLETYRARFYQEARAAGQFHHPSIVTLYDMGMDETTSMPYLVMEYIEGENLKTRINREGALPWPEVVRIGYHVALGLDYAHRRGVVHRDIKSANIILSREQVKITDFGIAHMPQSDLTRTGQLLGSPSYMAPEILRNEPLTPRADLFSLGVVLFEALTGVKPFRGETVAAVTMKILHAEPTDPQTIRPDTPAALRDLILELLRKNPDDRIPDAETVAARLKPLAAPAETGDRPKPPPPVEVPAADEATVEDLDLEPEPPAAASTAVPSPPPRPSRTSWAWGLTGLVVLLGVASLVAFLTIREPEVRTSPVTPSPAATPKKEEAKPATPPSAPLLPLFRPKPPCPLRFTVKFPYNRLQVKVAAGNRVLIERVVYPWKKTIVGPLKEIVREVTLKTELPAGSNDLAISLESGAYRRVVQTRPECREGASVRVRVVIPAKGAEPKVTWSSVSPVSEPTSS